MPIGKKLLVRPLWENEFDAQGRSVLNIEPGLAFGTGSHPTTKLCLETLEDYINGGESVLDIGCGSGILSIASLLLGAENALGVDIDSLAVKTAIKNAEENGFDESKIRFIKGNLSDNVSGKYNIVVANIVADIIMQFNTQVGAFLEDDGVYITGGIIENRENDVLASFDENGYEVLERRENNGWLVFALRKK
jgi:ribosomal protein L11 methyltransferase